ncbi:MAG: thiosulfohydrolase SoxB [Rhodovibrio sp.]|nr:thiosulfohydrolase SoxB [Rhodovibrio sp.]
MLTRRDLLQVAVATAALPGLAPLARAAASQQIDQARLLDFQPKGRLTLMNLTDIHAQLVPVYFREPSVNIGVGRMEGQVPHLTGKDFLREYGIEPGSLQAYMLSSVDFVELARQYGRVGGLDRIATLVKAIREERGRDNTLLLDGGDTWQGSYTALQTEGADMVRAMNALGVDAMTGHWEFTYGAQRFNELKDKADAKFLAGNVIDKTWEEPVFDGIQMFERAGTQVAVIGQAFPYTPIANPDYLIPDWSFGIREDNVRKEVGRARAKGAEVVVLLSHDGFDVDRKLARRVDGIDVIFTAHTHDAIPQPEEIDGTLLISSGSHGKFLSRLDLDVRDGRVADWSYRLIPVLSDAIDPDPEMTGVVEEIRAPHLKTLQTVLGQTETPLYRRGNFNGTWDDLICQALMSERDADISLSPGFRWGAALLPGQDITVEDVYNQTAITYPEAYRQQMSGEQLKLVLEDVADNLFNPDPYYQQGGDMVRMGGLGYRIDVRAERGERISEMTLLKTGERIDPARDYTVAGWASVNQGTEGPPIWEVVSDYIRRQGTVKVERNEQIEVVNA